MLVTAGVNDGGKAAWSRTTVGIRACLCWFEVYMVYINNGLCVQFNVLVYLMGAVTERGDPTHCSELCVLTPAPLACTSEYMAAGEAVGGLV